jgi:hypothetical protein
MRAPDIVQQVPSAGKTQRRVSLPMKLLLCSRPVIATNLADDVRLCDDLRQNTCRMHTITRSLPDARRIAGWINLTSSVIVTSLSRAWGAVFRRTFALTPRFSFDGPVQRPFDASASAGPPSLHALRRAPFLSTAEGDTERSHDTRGRKCEAGKTHSDHRCELDPGVYIILDHDLQSKRGVME